MGTPCQSQGGLWAEEGLAVLDRVETPLLQTHTAIICPKRKCLQKYIFHIAFELHVSLS